MDDPGADGVHLLDAAEVQRDGIGHRVDFALGRSGAGNGDRPGAAIRLLSGLGIGCGGGSRHCGRTCSKSPEAASPRYFATLLPRLMPYIARPMTSEALAKPLFVTVGDNPARAFSMGAPERAKALAIKARLDPAEQGQSGRSTVYADLNWTWDPEWLVALAGMPGSVLTKGGHPVLAHVPADGDPAAVLTAMRSGGDYQGDLKQVDADTADFSYRKLRKRDRPFVMQLDPLTVQ